MMVGDDISRGWKKKRVRERWGEKERKKITETKKQREYSASCLA